jgi:hypothetical protein
MSQHYGSLASILAENNIMTQAKEINAKIVRFSLRQLKSVACDRIPAKRQQKAERYLTETWGEREVPPSEYLDKVFGLDVVIDYKGWRIGLDVTLDPEAVYSKRRKQQQLMVAYRALGIDKAGVIIADGTPLQEQLSAIIRS